MAGFPDYKVVQNAYMVEDLDAAIERFTRMGYGPWLVLRNPPGDFLYRGDQRTSPTISVAFCQAGDIQIELMFQHDDEPSCLRDHYAKGESGFHHTAMFVDNFDEAVKAYEEAGFPCAMFQNLPDGSFIAHMDTSAVNGHMVEIYSSRGGICGAMFAAVRNLSSTHDREEIVDAATLLPDLAG